MPKLREPAFPVKTITAMDFPGLLLRDYFAAAALQGLLSGRPEHMTMTEAAVRTFAQYSYQLADLMMEHREK